MAATGKTPILLYGSTTATNTPSAGNLTNSSDGCEIAINVADKNLFFKDSTNVVNTVPIGQSSTSSNGWLSSTDWNTFNGKAPSFTYTTGYIPFGQGTTTPNQSANLFWDNANTRLGVGTSSPSQAIHTSSGGSATYNQITKTGTGASNLIIGAANAQTQLISRDGTTGAVPLNVLTGTTQVAQFGAANFTVNVGNVVIGTSGKGIDFSATAGTGTSELLADYEEGTWTPTDQSGAGLSITVDHALYTKIGRLVTVNAYITYPATASTATALISLPYTPAKYDIGAASATNGNAYSTITIGGATWTSFRNSFATLLTNANLSSASLLFTISYTV